MVYSAVISTLYLAFFIFSFFYFEGDDKLLALVLFGLSFFMFIFFNAVFHFDPGNLIKPQEEDNISRVLYIGLLSRLVRKAFYTFSLIICFNISTLAISLFYGKDQIWELLFYFNAVFGVMLFSVLINLILFGYKVFRGQRSSLSWQSIILRTVLGVLVFFSLAALLGFSTSIAHIFFYGVFLISAIYYFYNENYEKYNKHVLDKINDSDKISDLDKVNDSYCNEESSDASKLKEIDIHRSDNIAKSWDINQKVKNLDIKQMIRTEGELPSNLAQNVTFLKMLIKMMNYTITDTIKLKYPYTGYKDFIVEQEFMGRTLYTINTNALKQSIINEFIADLDSVMFCEADFQSRLNFVLHLFFILISQGRKAIPMMIIGYLIYVYQNSVLKEEELVYLKQKIEQVISNYTLRTPVRMVEAIIFWQYMNYLRKGDIPSIKKLPKFVKKRLKKVLENYSPLTLKKAKLLRKSIKLKDLIKILRPKPKDRLMAVLYGGIIQDSKISKLKENEVVPRVVKSDDMLKSKIESLPIQALLKNLSNIDFENTEVFEKVKERLINVINSMHKLKRYVNIFDFYIPIFVIPQEDVIKISQKVKDFQLYDLKNKVFSPYETSQHVLSSLFVNSIIDIAGFSSFFDFEKVEKVAMMIDYLLILEEAIRIKNNKVEAGNYSVLADYRTRKLLEEGKLEIDQIFNEISFNKEKWINRQRMKDLLNNVISLYLSESKINKKVSLIIRKIFNNYHLINSSVVISFLTSLYSDFEILIYTGKELKNYTKLYREITEYTKPIDKYLKTFSFISQLYVRDNTYVSFISFYESVANYLISNDFSSGDNNFLILDHFALGDIDENSINIFKLFTRGLNNGSKKLVVYNHSADYKGDSYFNINGVHFISSIIHPFTFEIIDKFFD